MARFDVRPAKQAHFEALRVGYAKLIADPADEATQVSELQGRWTRCGGNGGGRRSSVVSESQCVALQNIARNWVAALHRGQSLEGDEDHLLGKSVN